MPSLPRRFSAAGGGIPPLRRPQEALHKPFAEYQRAIFCFKSKIHVKPLSGTADEIFQPSSDIFCTFGMFLSPFTISNKPSAPPFCGDTSS
jgi:hypothetical protein